MRLTGYNKKGVVLFDYEDLTKYSDDELEEVFEQYSQYGKDSLLRVELVMEPNKTIEDYHQMLIDRDGRGVAKHQKLYFDL